jgi:hypothetical protein
LAGTLDPGGRFARSDAFSYPLTQMRLAVIRNIFAALTLLAASESAVVAAAQDESKLWGDWRGDSTCVATGTACRDEKVIYHIAKIPGKSGYVAITGDKIVNGATITMGTLEFRYDPDKQTLVREQTPGVWVFTVDGNQMEGTLTHPDKTILRRVTLKKDG